MHVPSTLGRFGRNLATFALAAVAEGGGSCAGTTSLRRNGKTYGLGRWCASSSWRRVSRAKRALRHLGARYSLLLRSPGKRQWCPGDRSFRFVAKASGSADNHEKLVTFAGEHRISPTWRTMRLAKRSMPKITTPMLASSSMLRSTATDGSSLSSGTAFAPSPPSRTPDVTRTSRTASTSRTSPTLADMRAILPTARWWTRDGASASGLSSFNACESLRDVHKARTRTSLSSPRVCTQGEDLMQRPLEAAGDSLVDPEEGWKRVSIGSRHRARQRSFRAASARAGRGSSPSGAPPRILKSAPANGEDQAQNAQECVSAVPDPQGLAPDSVPARRSLRRTALELRGTWNRFRARWPRTCSIE